ncbi:hypothetical protein CRG98_019020 [Punica granatum]|uniref:Uncharacterized protein n=1 Tax=Punica granatum TaxID=22663 RepID=A0A2I0JW49_PUNGR|nr:hypothetical protein CRG98_019020 [Punica granatum]
MSLVYLIDQNGVLTINMINICPLGKYETKKEEPTLFVIDYVPVEISYATTESASSLAPFVIQTPPRVRYQNNKVPWTYEANIEGLEKQMDVLGMTCSGHVYENPQAESKGMSPSIMSETAPAISKRNVTDEEVDAFIKVIKASEYKDVEQMGKSPTTFHSSPSSGALSPMGGNIEGPHYSPRP